jgi:hypothetical protein
MKALLCERPEVYASLLIPIDTRLETRCREYDTMIFPYEPRLCSGKTGKKFRAVNQFHSRRDESD